MRLPAIVVLFAALTLPASRAAAVGEPPLLQVSAGLGLAVAEAPPRPLGSGVYAAGEYVLRPTTWLTPRFYAGLLFVSPGGDCAEGVTPCEVSSRIGFAGAKARLMAPIPYVGPFVELGLGASIGGLTTRVGTLDASRSGVILHVPWALGLAVGSRHQVELSFRYLEHPAAKQTNGGMIFGVSFPLE